MSEGLDSLKEKIRAKEAGWRREEELKRGLAAADPQPVPEPQPLKPQEQPIPENRPSLAISWGQGVSKRTPEPAAPSGGKAAPLVGKMPWLKTGGATNGSTAGAQGQQPGSRRSKFGPPVGAASILPPPSLATEMPQLATGGAPPGGVDPAPSPAPPVMPGYGVAPGPGPGMGFSEPGSEYNMPPMNMMGGMAPGMPEYGGYPQQQQPQPEQAQQEQQPPEQQQPPKPSRNPKPQPMDMEAMLAAAQQHMQKSLTTKLMSIGVPVQRWEKLAHNMAGADLPSSEPDLPESIPLPGQDTQGVDMDIADIPAPPQHIPMPGESSLDDIAAPDQDDIAAPDEDLAAPGEEECPPGEEDLAPPGCD